MIGLLTKLFGLFQAVSRLWADRQLLNAGGAQEREAAIKEVHKRVEKAERAASVSDDARTERLRTRFDRARNRK